MIDADIVTLIIARTRSSRLPGKIFLTIRPEITILEQTIIQVKESSLSKTALLFDENSTDKIAKSISNKYKIDFYRGNENPTKRIIDYLKGLKKLPKFFIRVTADNPLLSIEALSKLNEVAKSNAIEKNIDYFSFPDLLPGTKPEMFSVKSLLKIEENCFSNNLEIGEHLTLYYLLNKKLFNHIELKTKNNLEKFDNVTLTVDTIYQYENLVELLNNLDLVEKQIFYKDLKEKYIKNYPHKKIPLKKRYKNYKDYIL